MNDYIPHSDEVERIEQIFRFHSVHPGQQERYEEIQARAEEYAKYLLTVCPTSRELSLAITHLQEVVMFANASIAKHEYLK